MKKIDEKFSTLRQAIHEDWVNGKSLKEEPVQCLNEIKHEFMRMHDNLNKIEEGLFGDSILVDERSIGEIVSVVWDMKLRDEGHDKTVAHWEKLCELIDADRQRLEDRCERQQEAIEVAIEQSKIKADEACQRLRKETAVALQKVLYPEECWGPWNGPTKQ